MLWACLFCVAHAVLAVISMQSNQWQDGGFKQGPLLCAFDGKCKRSRCSSIVLFIVLGHTERRPSTVIDTLWPLQQARSRRSVAGKDIMLDPRAGIRKAGAMPPLMALLREVVEVRCAGSHPLRSPVYAIENLFHCRNIPCRWLCGCLQKPAAVQYAWPGTCKEIGFRRACACMEAAGGVH